MEELINYILRYGQLNPQQIELVKKNVETIYLKKGEYFSEAGKIARQVGFLTQGVIRVCYYSNKGDEFTRCFMTENRFVVDINSFYNETPCSEYVEALSDCELLVFSQAAFHELANTILPWTDIFNKIISNALMNKMQASSIMLTQDASTRYENFLKLYPGLANRVPLSNLASYLGITQSSLSRIRKNF